MLNFIEERLAELETEKEELTEYEQLDKHRRALEYNLYDKELSKATEQLGQIEVVREEERDRQQGLHARLRAIQDELQVEEELGLTVRQALDRLAARRAEKASDLAEVVSRRSAIEVELQETEVMFSTKAVSLLYARKGPVAALQHHHRDAHPTSFQLFEFQTIRLPLVPK